MACCFHAICRFAADILRFCHCHAYADIALAIFTPLPPFDDYCRVSPRAVLLPCRRYALFAHADFHDAPLRWLRFSLPPLPPAATTLAFDTLRAERAAIDAAIIYYATILRRDIAEPR